MRMPRARRSRKAWLSLAAWAGLLGGVAVLVVLAGLTSALRSTRPDAALAMLPGDARALAKRADMTLLTGALRPADISAARTDARAALMRDTTLPAAWRVLGLTEREGSPASLRLLHTAQALSRRDVPTQIGLLEAQVERGNIISALRHYDIILRISTAYDPMLFPVLAGAMTEPQILRPLSKRLANAPMWRRRFLSYVVNAGTSFEEQAALFDALNHAGGLQERDILAASITNSASVGQLAVAQRLYRIMAPDDATRPLRNGQFEDAAGIAPFDWQLETTGPLSVAVATAQGQRRLEMASVRGDGGRAARQLLALPPGRYRLGARFGTLEGQNAGIPYMTLACAATSSVVTTAEAPMGRDSFTADGTIPTACRYQWLELGLRLDPHGTSTSAWIDAVIVQRTAPAKAS